MRERLFKTYKAFQNNTTNYFVYYDHKKRIVKPYNEFYNDVELCIARLNSLSSHIKIDTIAILGPASYQWVVIDYACILGGFCSVAIPETASYETVKNTFNDIPIDLFLCDFVFKDKYTIPNQRTYFFNCTENIQSDLDDIRITDVSFSKKENLIRENYSIVFSSGTSEKTKYINIQYYKLDAPKKGIVSLIKRYLNFRKSIYADLKRKNNKIIVFLPLSHQMQRMFIELALINKINVVLSDPQNCFLHIVKEKPNIMIAVPPIYEAMAYSIKQKCDSFSGWEKKLYVLFNKLQINSWSNRNFMKKGIQSILFSNIKKIYGGAGDLFVVGSAPSNPVTLKTFYEIGVKILEAYGQSELAWVVSMNTPRQFRLGSVGKPHTKLQLKINEDSEVLIKYEKKCDELNEKILEIDDNGYIHTRDLGYIDKDGFLFITGRKDDTIILENGKKIQPNKIETILKRNNFIRHALVYSPDNLQIKTILNCSEMTKLSEVNHVITRANLELATYEQISSFIVIQEPFTIENGLLTSTLKMKRKSIIDKYGQYPFNLVDF